MLAELDAVGEDEMLNQLGNDAERVGADGALTHGDNFEMTLSTG